MNRNYYLAPSVLSADFAKLGEEIRSCAASGAQLIHLDIMDGCFVPNITFGAPVIKAVRGYTDAIFDVHMMVEEPARYIDDFAAAGADIITVHAEACRHLDRTLQKIRECGKRAGVVLNPATPVSVVEDLIPELDMVLLMSVNPGFGGQKYIPYVTDKIRKLRVLADRLNPALDIEVDGGVTLDNVDSLIEAGANVFVAGSAVFKGVPSENIKSFLQCFSRH